MSNSVIEHIPLITQTFIEKVQDKQDSPKPPKSYFHSKKNYFIIGTLCKNKA